MVVHIMHNGTTVASLDLELPVIHIFINWQARSLEAPKGLYPIIHPPEIKKYFGLRKKAFVVIYALILSGPVFYFFLEEEDEKVYL